MLTISQSGLVSVDGNTVSTLTDFDNLSRQIATVSPTGPNSASFTPTNSPQACPTQDADFSAAASPLPPVADSGLCECMYNSLGCTVADSVSSDDYGDLFGVVCGLQDGICDGIAANGTTGSYGAFGMCNSKQQLGYALNAYYQANNNPSACDFSGSAATVAAATPTGSCVAALSSAGGVTGGSASGSGGSSTSTKKGSASSVSTVAGVDVGYLSVGIMAWVAVVSGVGMVAL